MFPTGLEFSKINRRIRQRALPVGLVDIRAHEIFFQDKKGRRSRRGHQVVFAMMVIRETNIFRGNAEDIQRKNMTRQTAESTG